MNEIQPHVEGKMNGLRTGEDIDCLISPLIVPCGIALDSIGKPIGGAMMI
jgi:hypothetical protein